MIPSQKLFEIIKYAGELGFDTHITGQLGTVEFSMCDEHIIRYNWLDPEIKVIVNEKMKEKPVECDIRYLITQNGYYQDLLKLANMLQGSIIPNEEDR